MGMHSSVYKGKRVRIKLRDGRVIIGRFVERRAPYVFLDCAKVHLRDVDSFGIYKAKQ